nr:glycosyltransferase family 2 protein [Syntrophomonas palmitatica]
MDILVIIPAFNEEQNIIGLLDNIRKDISQFDVLVINDASQDNTSFLAKNMGFNVIDLPINLGIGGAMQTGYLFAYYHHYDIAVQLDGDGQHDPQYIDNLIKPLISKDADMVIGSRFIVGEGFQSTIFRRFGIRFFEKLISFLTGQRFSDPTSGFRACNKAVIAYFAHHYPFDYPEPESLVSIYRKGFKIVEIPVVMHERKAGRSSIHSFKIIYYMIKVPLAILIEMLKKNGKERYMYDGTKATGISNNS